MKLTPERNHERSRKARAGFRGDDSSDGSLLVVTFCILVLSVEVLKIFKF